MNKNILAVSMVFFILAIAIGAFGAHGLKSLVPADRIQMFEVGVRYQFLNSLALMIVGFNSHQMKFSLKWPIRLVYSGVFLFSGSIYLLTMNGFIGIKTQILGPLTPLGGLFMIVGWCIFSVRLVRS